MKGDTRSTVAETPQGGYIGDYILYVLCTVPLSFRPWFLVNFTGKD